MPGPQRDQPRGQQILRDGLAGGHREPALVAGAQRGGAGGQGVGRVDGRPRPVGDQGAGAGQGRAARRTVQQGQPEPAFQLTQAGAGGRLGDAVRGRRPADTAQPGDAEQQVERGEVGDLRRQRHNRSL
nr:hypothetical protein GCM10020092_044950 [Actinoplanes digitatis]